MNHHVSSCRSHRYSCCIPEEHLVLYDAILRHEEHFEQAEESDGGSPRSFTEERLENIQSIYDNFIKDGQFSFLFRKTLRTRDRGLLGLGLGLGLKLGLGLGLGQGLG
jgi:hypothetical protein